MYVELGLGEVPRAAIEGFVAAQRGYCNPRYESSLEQLDRLRREWEIGYSD